MNLFQLIIRELWHRRVNAMLSVMAVACTVALVVSVRMLTGAAERETRRVMRDIGFNLRILPKDVDVARFLAEGQSDKTLPADAVQRLAAAAGTFVSFNHLTPSLERRILISDGEALLTGLGASVVGPGEKKAPMGFTIPDGKVFLGWELARRLNTKAGGTVTFQGKRFAVQRVLTETGTQDDVRMYTSLADAQQLLGLPGRISEIKAIDCLCLTGEQDVLAQLRAALKTALPEAQVLQLRAMADARARQRQSSEKYTGFVIPLVLSIGAVWLGVLAALNVRERRPELGLWRALGKGSIWIGALVLGRALMLGVSGAIAGYLVGTILTVKQGPTLYPVTSGSLVSDISLLYWALLLAPGFAALASFLPAMLAVSHDPAETLRAE